MEPTHVFEQHPVPQHISSYQFRLVGDMTIKQFLELAAGAGISLLFYASPLPAFLKWPFIIFFALAGAALAFLPIQDRPLEQWVSAFFRSIYSPTILYWVQPSEPIKFFADEAATLPATQTGSPAGDTVPQAQSPLESFTKNLEEAEQNVLGKISGLFHQSPSAPTASNTPPSSQPSETVAGVITPASPPPTSNEPAPESGIIYETPPSTPSNENKLNVVKEPKKEIVAPREQRIALEKKGFQTPTSTPQNTVAGQATEVSQTLPETQLPPAPVGQPSENAGGVAPPLPPSQPNIIVGQVIDQKGNILDGAILEVKDPLGRPVRALRTNKTGHFMIVTPLGNGKYQLLTEKEGHSFDPIEIEAKGNLIPPITIKAK